MSRLIRRIAAAAAATLIAISLAGPARADDFQWRPIPCFSGGIDRAVVTRDGGLIELDGHVDCSGPNDGGVTFGYARYHGAKRGGVYWSTMHGYAAVAPSSNSILRDLPAGEFAICLVTGFDVRVGCVKITPVPGEPVAVAPLPTDDSLVHWPVEVIGGDSETSPTCGTCW